MIFRQDILRGQQCPPDLEDNLLEMLVKINKVCDAWGKPMTVTSGLRSKADQVAIYVKKGITDIAQIPMASKHLSAQAIDIFDPERDLQKWVVQNTTLIEEIGLWMEDFKYTKNWIHFQTVPPKSKKRFFIPK